MAGYLIASLAFAVAFLLGFTGWGRPLAVVAVGAFLGLAWLAAAALNRADEAGEYLPLWLFAALIGLLYAIWCGGFWVGLRLRRARSRA